MCNASQTQRKLYCLALCLYVKIEKFRPLFYSNGQLVKTSEKPVRFYWDTCPVKRGDFSGHTEQVLFYMCVSARVVRLRPLSRHFPPVNEAKCSAEKPPAKKVIKPKSILV